MAMENAGALAGRTLGGYQIVSLLGVGGMAEVYRARDEALGRDVAVKVLPQTLAHDPDYVQRFRDEGRRVAALDHPHVVPVYQFGEEDGLLFLVMPLLRESLRDKMVREGIFAPEAAARVTLEIAEALDAAHSLGLVHRDVKPENVLLDADGKALLTDFGIARPEARLREAGAARTLASTGLPVGTPEYMAPEQLKAETIDHRVDVYGLGAVLYELVTGMVPYEGATPYEVAANVLTVPLSPPSTHRASLWPELDAVIVTALAKHPDARYRDVRSFAASLHRAIVRHDPTVTGFPLPTGWATAAPDTARMPVVGEAQDGERLDRGVGDGGVEWWRERLRRPPVTSRRALIALAAAVLLLVGVCGGSGLAILGQFSRGGSPGDLLSSLVSAATDTTGVPPAATATSGSGSVNSGHATAGVGAPPSGPGTPIATVGPGTPVPTDTAIPGATPTPTPLPTSTPAPTPRPTATNTPLPSPLVLSPSSAGVALSRANGYCTGQQTITNNNATAVSWQWTSESPSIAILYYSVGSSSGWGMPATTTAAGATDTLMISMQCSHNQSNAITMTDALGDSYTFTLHLP